MERHDYEARRTQLEADLAERQREYEHAAYELDQHRRAPDQRKSEIDLLTLVENARRDVHGLEVAIGDLDAAWNAAERQQLLKARGVDEKRLGKELTKTLQTVDLAALVAKDLDQALCRVVEKLAELCAHQQQLPGPEVLLSIQEIEHAVDDFGRVLIGEPSTHFQIGKIVAERAAKLRARLEREYRATLATLNGAGAPEPTP